MVQEMIKSIQSLNPSIDDSAASLMANYKLSMLSSNMKVSVEYIKAKSPAPLNWYSILLLQSGGGKNSSLELLDDWYFKDIISKLTNIFDYYKKQHLEDILDEEAKAEEAKALAHWTPALGDATAPAIMQLVNTLYKLGINAPSFEVDELDKFIVSKEEMINQLYGAYDNGNWLPKAIKSEATQEAVKGVAPNFFSFGTFEGLFLEDKVADKAKSLLGTGLARRSFCYYEDDDKLPTIITARERMELEDKAETLRESAVNSATSLLKLVREDNFKKVLKMSSEARIAMYEFREQSEEKALEVKDAILNSELLGRHFKCVKLAATYAFVDGRDEVSIDDVNYAISITEHSTDSLQRMTRGQSKLDRLYLKVRSTGRFVDTNEALEWGIYPSNLTTKIKDHFKELEDLSYKHGDVYEVMNIGTLTSVKIKQLISTDSESCIMSASMPQRGEPRLGDGFRKAEIPFESIPHWITQENVCYSAATFKQEKRDLAHAESLSNLIILDVDEDMSMDYAKELFANHYAIIAPTRNHQKEKNGVTCDRFRVILLADKYLNTNGDVHKEFMKNIAQYYSVTIDGACFDKSRFYFANPSDEIWMGTCEEKFEVAKLIPKEVSKTKIETYVPNGGGALKAWFKQEASKLNGTGGIDFLVKVAMSAQDRLEMKEDDAEKFLEEVKAIMPMRTGYWTKEHSFEKEVLPALKKAYN